MFVSALASVVVVVPSAGCKMLRDSRPTPTSAASPEDRVALIDQVKTLEGEWIMTDDAGNEIWTEGEGGEPLQIVSVIKVTSGGCAVREVLFRGVPDEGTNVYHMDGPDLIVTRYAT